MTFGRKRVILDYFSKKWCILAYNRVFRCILDSKSYRRTDGNKRFVGFAWKSGSKRSKFDQFWSMKIGWFMYYSFLHLESKCWREGYHESIVFIRGKDRILRVVWRLVTSNRSISDQEKIITTRRIDEKDEDESDNERESDRESDNEHQEIRCEGSRDDADVTDDTRSSTTRGHIASKDIIMTH